MTLRRYGRAPIWAVPHFLGSMTIVQWDNCTVRQLYSRQLYSGQLYSIRSFFKKLNVNPNYRNMWSTLNFLNFIIVQLGEVVPMTEQTLIRWIDQQSTLGWESDQPRVINQVSDQPVKWKSEKVEKYRNRKPSDDQTEDWSNESNKRHRYRAP